MINTIAFAGSFDPMTNGHLWVIKEALKIVENVRVIVANNPSKNYMFSSKQRKEIIEKIVIDEQLQNVQIDIVKDDYVSSYLTMNNITHMIRGIRNSADFDQEKLIQRVNSEILGNVETIFIMPPSDLESVSSSFVKSLIGPNDWPFYIKKFLPKASLNAIFVNVLTNEFEFNIDDPVIFNVIKAYQNDNRYYHNLEHIMMMLIQFKNIASPLDWEINKNLEYAILLHDAIYQHDITFDKIVNLTNNLPNKDNEYPDEVLSSYIAKYIRFIGQGNAYDIEKFVLATMYNRKIDHKAEYIMRYLDLSILGKKWVIYEDYMNNIRKEYNQYSDEEYKKGRISVLTDLIKMFKDGDIFKYHYFDYSKTAIENMNKEIELLSK